MISEEGIADMDLPDNILDELDYLDNITSCNKVSRNTNNSWYKTSWWLSWGAWLSWKITSSNKFDMEVIAYMDLPDNTLGDLDYLKNITSCNKVSRDIIPAIDLS